MRVYAGQVPVPFFNGKCVDYVTAFDTVEGWIETLCFDGNGRILSKKGQLLTERQHGVVTVAFVYPEDAAEVAALAEAPPNKYNVPAGQTPLDENLRHRYLDVINEGMKARDAGTGSPYHGQSLEHCLHAHGWVQRDLRIAFEQGRTLIGRAWYDYEHGVTEIPEGLVEARYYGQADVWVVKAPTTDITWSRVRQFRLMPERKSDAKEPR